ncbi:tetratricopeptide repeat protein [Microbacterium sp. Clip185]|uniref:tetratricopeptide repeat protein n=1 Tax=Microbacterium sp. Clip185 TaxID=3025663 RepID=UPI00236666F3|nr:tetratricopeptide repeat protein [Microbacterium sp. Clip185]WDG17297.1 tetratricopeptide repeat protein [Microbacterium sp. Clip185]
MSEASEAALAHAQTLLDLGRHEDALREAGRELAQQPESAPALRISAECLRMLQRLDEADDLARRAVALYPHDAWAWRLSALTALGLRRWDDAVLGAQAVRRLSGETLWALSVYADVMLGCSRVNEAIAALDEALRQQPDDPDLHTQLADALVRAGRRRDAEEHVSAALAIDPTHPWARRLRPAISRREDDADAAIQLARMLGESPQDSDTETAFEMASARLLVPPLSIVASQSALIFVLCALGAGLFGWRVPTDTPAVAGVLAQICVWAAALGLLVLWAIRLRRRLGSLFEPIVRSRLSEGPIVLFSSIYLAGAVVLSGIGILMGALAGDPTGTIIVLGGVVSAYTAAVLVAALALVARLTYRRGRALAPLLYLALAPGAVVGVVLLALFLTGAVLYIIAWALSGERLPEPFWNRLPDRRRQAPASPRT